MLSLSQEQDGQLKLVTGKGGVNGQDFLIDAKFPVGGRFHHACVIWRCETDL